MRWVLMSDTNCGDDDADDEWLGWENIAKIGSCGKPWNEELNMQQKMDFELVLHMYARGWEISVF